jgi:hypothetical protein
VGLGVSARDVVRDLPRRLTVVPRGAHAGAGPRPPVHGKPPRALYAYGHDTRLPLGRRHVAATQTRAGAPPSATGRSPTARRQLPWRPCRGSCSHDAQMMLLATLLVYKTPRVSSLRTPENAPSAAVAISAAVVSLPFCLLSGPTESLAPFPNLHQSLPDHLWLSFPPHIRREPRRRGGVAVASPPAITGPFPGQVSVTNRPLVSPIELPARLFASPGPTSSPAGVPLPSGYGWGGPSAHL